MRTVLMCHDDSALDLDGIARWLAGISTLVGIIAIREEASRLWRRVRREVRRVGPIRFLDVLAFRAYYRAVLARRDNEWRRDALAQLRIRYTAAPADIPVLRVADPNAAEVKAFIAKRAPDLMLARCKALLREDVFSIPAMGTFVLHPGICPEYRNAHGCFWALARDDHGKVGMTLLRIDRGVDTGPVFGYYSCEYDARRDSHVVIQDRMVLDNLESIGRKLVEIHGGHALPLDTAGRPSGAWGQPWLTAYLRWKRKAKAGSVTTFHPPAPL